MLPPLCACRLPIACTVRVRAPREFAFRHQRTAAFDGALREWPQTFCYLAGGRTRTAQPNPMACSACIQPVAHHHSSLCVSRSRLDDVGRGGYLPIAICVFRYALCFSLTACAITYLRCMLATWSRARHVHAPNGTVYTTLV